MKAESPDRDATSENKKELQAFLWIINYSSKFSPSTASKCESLRQLTWSKTEWTWNETYQKLFDKAKSIIKEDVFMKFCIETQPLYLEVDTSEVMRGATLLQTRSGTSCPRDKTPDNNILRPIPFASKSLSSAERRYCNIEREALGILHGFHHYCLVREVSIITNHKQLVAIFRKDVTMLLQRLLWILLRIQQYRVRIIYKLRPNLFIAD